MTQFNALNTTQHRSLTIRTLHFTALRTGLTFSFEIATEITGKYSTATVNYRLKYMKGLKS